MATYFTVVTDTGLTKIAAALAAGTTVNLTEMAIGDGNGNPVTVSQTRTALVRVGYRDGLNQLYQDNNVSSLFIAELVVPTAEGGWTVREVGLFDDEGDLIAYANFPATYKPTLAEGATQDLIIQIYVQVSNADAISVSINPLIVQATRQWVQANFLSLLGGTTGQIIRKKSNADNDIEWVNLNLADFNITVIAEEEAQTLATAQTTVTWANISTDGIAVYVDGIRLRQGIDYTVTNGTTIELGSSYPDGTPILGVRNDPNGSITPGGIGALAITQNLADVQDKAAGRGNLGVSYSSQAEAEAGTEAAKVLSPLTAKQQVDARVASQAQAQGGTDNVKLMTSLRTKQQIDARLASDAQAIDVNNNVNLVTPRGVKKAIDAHVIDRRAWFVTGGVVESITGTWEVAGGVVGITFDSPDGEATGDLYYINFNNTFTDGWYVIDEAEQPPLPLPQLPFDFTLPSDGITSSILGINYITPTGGQDGLTGTFTAYRFVRTTGNIVLASNPAGGQVVVNGLGNDTSNGALVGTAKTASVLLGVLPAAGVTGIGVFSGRAFKFVNAAGTEVAPTAHSLVYAQ